MRSGHRLLPPVPFYPASTRARGMPMQSVMETAAEKHVLISHAGPEAYAPMTRVILAKHGKAGRKMGLPFGPFLAIGSVVALFWGHDLLQAYFSTLR